MERHVGLGTRAAVAAAHAALVEDVAVAIACSFGDATSTTNAALVGHQAGVVVHCGVGIVVARCFVRASEDILGACVAASVRVACGASRSGQTVGVPVVVGDRRTRRTVLHVVNQVLLIRPSIDGVLVFHIASRRFNGHAVDAVSIVVQQLVESAVGRPTPNGAGHEHFVEIDTGAAHVHVEGGVVQARTVVCSRLFVVVVGAAVHAAQHVFNGGARVAAVPADHWQRSFFHHFVHTVGEAT